MLIRRPEQVAPQQMAMPGASRVSMRLMVGRSDGAPNFSMRLFEVEPGGHTPQHQHNYEHELLILEGSGQVQGGVNGSTIRPIQAGDVIFMPPNELHQFKNTGPTTLKMMCMVPTQFDCGGSAQPTPGS